jgi:cytochrome c553
MKTKYLLLKLVALTLVVSGQAAIGADTVVTTLQAEYRTAGAGTFSADTGKAAWKREVTASDGKLRSCTGCHGPDLTQQGKHAQTQKIIAAMAPSVNPKRLTDRKKVEKWLQRNCKWTWGRECTPQEKGDILAYLSTL